MACVPKRRLERFRQVDRAGCSRAALYLYDINFAGVPACTRDGALAPVPQFFTLQVIIRHAQLRLNSCLRCVQWRTLYRLDSAVKMVNRVCTCTYRDIQIQIPNAGRLDAAIYAASTDINARYILKYITLAAMNI